MKLSDTQLKVVDVLRENPELEVIHLPAATTCCNKELVCYRDKKGMHAGHLYSQTVEALAKRKILIRKNQDPWFHIYKLHKEAIQ